MLLVQQFFFQACQYYDYFVIANCGNPLDRSRFNISNVQAIGNSIPALEGDDVTFSCPFGLQINGSNTSTCMGNGKWEPDPQEVECIGNTNFFGLVDNNSKYSSRERGDSEHCAHW